MQMKKTVVTRIVLMLALIAAPLASVFAPSTVNAAVANGKVVFETDRDGNNEIYSMNPDGSGQARLTNDSAYDSSPVWSPDGTKVIFTSDRSGNSDIFVMNADGSNQTNLTNTAADDSYPIWSPDGTKIAFLSYPDGNFEIYVMNADGSGQTRLTNNAASESVPVWSPGSTKLTFRTDRDGNNEIYVMNADGSSQTNLTNNAAGDWSPIWSPDGTKIAFESYRDGDGEIYVMNADGSNQINLTNTAADDTYPIWSPNGTKIAFSSDRDGNYETYVMDANGSNQTRLTNNAADDYFSTWSPDGAYIIFNRYVADPYSEKLYRTNADGSGGDILMGTQPDDSSNYVSLGGWAGIIIQDSGNTTINTTLNSVISMTTSGTVTLGVTPAGGARLSSGSDTVSVSTNNSTGFNLTLSNQDTTTTLVNGGNTIAAHAGTQASPTSLVANRWGYRVDGVGGFGAGPTSSETNAASSSYTWAGVPSSVSPNQLKNTNTTASNNTTTVWYVVMVDESVPNGTYSDTVTYTAVTN